MAVRGKRPLIARLESEGIPHRRTETYKQNKATGMRTVQCRARSATELD